MRRGISKAAILFKVVLFSFWIAVFPEPAHAQQTPLWFPFDGKSYFLLGANYPWYNGYRGLDLGRYLGSKTIASIAYFTPRNSQWYEPKGFDGRDLQNPSLPIRAGTTGFNAEGIKAQFENMRDIGIHVSRWFFVSDERALVILDQRGNCTGIDTTALENLDRVLDSAKANQVYLVPVLFDFRFVCGDHWLRFEDGTPGIGHADVIRDSERRKLLIENFVRPLVKRYANSSSILYWEIMNEAGNVVQGTDPVTGFKAGGITQLSNRSKVSVVEMQTFMNEVYDAIKSVDQTHPVMPSGLARPWQLPLVVGRVKADLFGAHYKDDGSDYGRVQPVANIKSELFRKFGLVLDKPLVMTEGPAQMQRHLGDYLESAFNGGWAGYLPWTYYRFIGLNDLKRYPRVVTSKDGKADAAANIEFYRRFNQEHASAVKLGM
jgi:hypothetical protein